MGNSETTDDHVYSMNFYLFLRSYCLEQQGPEKQLLCTRTYSKIVKLLQNY